MASSNPLAASSDPPVEAANPLAARSDPPADDPIGSTTTTQTSAGVASGSSSSEDPFSTGDNFDARKFIGFMWKTRETGQIKEVRSFLWALLLGACSTGKLGLQPWVEAFAASRKKYRDMKEKHAPGMDLSNVDPQVANPLAPMSANNPWAKRHEDQEILEEIWKDVERTYQEFEVYRKESTRRQLQQVLFNYCKEKGAEYRQGMNELCAVLHFVVATNATSGLLGKHKLAPTTSDDIEADTYHLFERLMSKGCGHMFLTEKAESAQKRKEAMQNSAGAKAAMGGLQSNIHTSSIPDADTALLARCGYVYHTVFKQVDPQLYKHLHNSLGVQPQLFLLRWIRCMFTRELTLEQVIECWDAILMDGFVRNKGSGTVVDDAKAVSTGEVALAASSCFPLVDYLAIAFAHAVRADLLQEDYSGALAIMLRYPTPPDVWPLVSKAEALRDPTNTMTRLARPSATAAATGQRGNFAPPPSTVKPQGAASKAPVAGRAPNANPLSVNPLADHTSEGSVAKPSPSGSFSGDTRPVSNPLAAPAQPRPQAAQHKSPTRDPLAAAPHNPYTHTSNGNGPYGRQSSGDGIWNTGKSLLGAAAGLAKDAYQTAAPAVRSALEDAGAVGPSAPRIEPNKLKEVIRRLEAFRQDLDWQDFDFALDELKEVERVYQERQQQAQGVPHQDSANSVGHFAPANF